MRLIDADKLTQMLPYEFYKNCNLSFSDIATIIKEQPTAYDVDKVVEQIKRYDDCDICNHEGKIHAGKDCKMCIIQERINIVKGGGQE